MRRPRRLLPAFLLAALLVLAPALALPEARELLRAAKESLAARDWNAARGKLDELIRTHQSAREADEAMLLKARAAALEGKHQDALAAADALLAARAESHLAAQARYARARALLASGKEAEAAQALEERMAALSGAAHRAALAALWLELADAHWADPSEPAPEGRAIDHPRAQACYERALALGPAADRREQALLRSGLSLLVGGDPESARARFQQLEKEAPKSALVPRAIHEQGMALWQLGQVDEARARWRTVESLGPASQGQAPRAVLRLAESYAGGGEEAQKVQIEHLQRLIATWPQDPLAAEARVQLAESLEGSGKLEPALAAWRELVEKHGDHERADDASLRAARLLLALGRFDETRAALAAHLARFPASETFGEAQEALATSWIDQGNAVEGEPRLAAWRAFLERYPVHPRAAEVQTAIGGLFLAAGKLEEAIAEWRTVAERFVGSEEGAQAQLLVATTCEEKLGDLPRATREYQSLVDRFPGTGPSGVAAQRLRLLKEKHLRLLTASSRTVAQGPAIQLATRNVTELELKAVKLDLLEYFERKQHLAQVEALAIEVVKPDQTWKHAIEGYQPFRLFESTLPLPLPKGPGAWVLSAEEETWKATTLVVVSDLTLVVKRAPGQVLVLVKDERTGKAAPGVDVLVSDGGRVALRGKTGPDGTWTATDGALHGQVRVLAHKDGHVAIDEGTPGSRSAFAMQTKVWAFTDRPVYRPGGTMRWKAFCRRVQGESYAFTAGEEARVSILDARGVRRTLDRLQLSKLGSLEGELALGEEPPLGDWTLEVSYAGAVYQAAFGVEAYKKPEVVVETTALEPDLLAGEQAKVRVDVRTYFGSPVAGAPVSWWVSRQPSEFDREAHLGFGWFKKLGQAERPPAGSEQVAEGEGTTDAEGRLVVTFPTEPLDRDMLYTLVVQSRGQDEVPVAGSLNLHVTTRGFYALVRSETRVARPRSTFKAIVETVDARHKGVPAKGQLEVVRLISGRGEQVVERLAVETNAQGRAEVPVTIQSPGDHALRFVGTDRRGGRVEGQDRLVVAGVAEDQEPSARIRADREVYRRGESAKVLVNGPAAGALALLTWEGEQVLRHRVIELAERSQTLDLQLDDACSPNVFLRVAIPHQGRLLEDQDEVLVFKFLELEVKSDKAEYGPGEQVALEVTAKDQAGNPVQAEVALAVVDEAIYAIRPDGTPEARPLFYDRRRTLGVTTGSSLDWRYEGVLKRQESDLLAEREERDMASTLAEEDDGRRLEMRSRRAAGPGGQPPAAAPAPKPSAPMEKNGKKRDEAKMADMAPAEEAAGALSFSDEEEGGGGGGGAGAAPRRNFADTAAWAPSLVTGADGKAKLTFKLPDDLTRWRITARGLSADTLAGDATGSFVTARELVVRLALPRVVTELDEWQKGLIVDHRRQANATGTAGIALGGAKGEKPLQLGPFAAQRLAWGPELAPPPLPLGPLVVRGWAEADGRKDALERTLPVVPAGWTERTARSGLLEGDVSLKLELPADHVPGTPRLTVRLIPSASDAVLDGLQYLEAFPYGCLEQTVSRFLPLVAAREVLAQSGLPHEALRKRLNEALLRGVGRILELQRPNGEWGWWADGSSDPALTGYALLGLVKASEAGAFVDPTAIGRGRDAALRALRQAGGDHEARAVLCQALAACGARGEIQDDLNRLAREKGSLSTQALALTLLARRQAEGQAPADLADAIRERLRRLPAADAPPGEARAWGGAAAEELAWGGLALLTARPQGDEALHQELVKWLRARQGLDGSWRSTRETAAVLLYLAASEGRRREALDLRVTVNLGNDAVAAIRLAGGQPGAERTVVLGPDRLKPGSIDLRLARQGAGSPRYVVELTYVQRGLPAKGARTVPLGLERRLVAGLDPRRARAFSGYDSIVEGGPSAGEGAPIEAMTVGERAWLMVTLDAGDDELPYAIAEVPLPAGVEVLADQVEGTPPDRLEAWDDKLVLFYSRVSGSITTSVLVQAVTPGRFALRPATTWLMYQPETHARSAGSRLRVDAEGGAGREPTPDERLIQARALQGEGKHREARALLDALLALPLHQEPRVEVLYRLFQCGLALEEPRLAVKSWEELRDLSGGAPDLPLTEHLGLARAYRGAGEPRRACELGFAVLVRLFHEEVALAAAYREEGRAIDAQVRLSEILRRYPDEEAVIEGWLGLARSWLDIPKPAGEGSPKRPKHWKPARGQDTHLEEAWEGFKDFCAWFPLDPRAAEAQSGAVEALSRLGDDEGVALEALAFARRYPRDPRLDDVLIQRLRSLHKQEKWEDAFACGKEILAWREPRAGSSETTRSAFTDEVLHTFGKIHHQRGELAQAVQHYAQVRGRIPDAQDAWAWLTQSALQVPDLVLAAPGEEPKMLVKSKNVEKIELKAWPVDLMLLFLTRKSLAGIQNVDLTGVTPLVQRAVELGKTSDYAWKETQVPLPVKQTGVYLVVGKVGGSLTSTIVVVTALELEVQRAQARVRAYVKTRDGKPAANAKVRISDGHRLVGRGTTDARGIFEAEAHVAQGRLSVVVEREGHYALFRE